MSTSGISEVYTTLVPKFESIRQDRDRVRSLTESIARHMGEIAAACTPDNKGFYINQSRPAWDIASAEARFASIDDSIAEIKATLASIRTTWEA